MDPERTLPVKNSLVQQFARNINFKYVCFDRVILERIHPLHVLSRRRDQVSRVDGLPEVFQRRHAHPHRPVKLPYPGSEKNRYQIILRSYKNWLLVFAARNLLQQPLQKPNDFKNHEKWRHQTCCATITNRRNPRPDSPGIIPINTITCHQFLITKKREFFLRF